MLPQRRCFSVRGPFWHASSENLATDECLGKLKTNILQSPTGGERIMVKLCHRRPVVNASRWNPAPAETWRTDHCETLLPAGHFGACLGEITQKPCPPEAVAPTGASELQSTKASSRPRIKLPARRPSFSRLCYPRVFRYTRLREAFITSLQRVNRTRTVVLIASLPFFVFDGTIRNEKKFEVAHSRTA